MLHGPGKRPDTRGAAAGEKTKRAAWGAEAAPSWLPNTNADLRLGREPGRDRVLGHVPLQGGRGQLPPTARVRVHRVRPKISVPPAASGQRPAKARPDTRAGARPEFQTNRAAWGAKTPANGAQKRKTACALGANWAGIRALGSRPASAAGRGNFAPPARAQAQLVLQDLRRRLGANVPPKKNRVPGGARPTASFAPREGREP